jgi:hypothetical protein
MLHAYQLTFFRRSHLSLGYAGSLAAGRSECRLPPRSRKAPDSSSFTSPPRSSRTTGTSPFRAATLTSSSWAARRRSSRLPPGGRPPPCALRSLPRTTPWLRCWRPNPPAARTSAIMRRLPCLPRRRTVPSRWRCRGRHSQLYVYAMDAPAWQASHGDGDSSLRTRRRRPAKEERLDERPPPASRPSRPHPTRSVQPATIRPTAILLAQPLTFS